MKELATNADANAQAKEAANPKAKEIRPSPAAETQTERADVEKARRSHAKAGFSRYAGPLLEGERAVIEQASTDYPEAFKNLKDPPRALYLVGDMAALQEGLAIVGARDATPYGLSCARRFGRAAAERGIVLISGGARGCDAEAHRAALAAGTPTVAFLGGGCDELYPASHAKLFQSIVDGGGAVVSEHPWNFPPLPHTFRARNRLIASLARATLIVEAGLPSGTFSTADEALAANRDVLVVPGAITSPTSRGANRLLYQGATPIVDDDTFQDVLFALFGLIKQQTYHQEAPQGPFPVASRVRSASKRAKRAGSGDPLVAALLAEPLGMDDLLEVARTLCKGADPYRWLTEHLADAERTGLIVRYPDARYGPAQI